MHYTAITSAGLLALATSAMAVSHQRINNHCPEAIYLTFTTGDGVVTGPLELNHSGTYVRDIVGTGNAIGITKSSDYWGSPKLTFGTSTSNGIIYWSTQDAGGDPFANEAFNVTSGGVAGETTQSSTQVFAGPDKNVELVLNACYDEA